MKRLFIASMVALLVVSGYGVVPPRADDAHHPKTSKKKATKAKQTKTSTKKSTGITQGERRGN